MVWYCYRTPKYPELFSYINKQYDSYERNSVCLHLGDHGHYKYQPTYLHHAQSTGNPCQRPFYALPSGDTSPKSGREAESEKISRKILLPVNQEGGRLDITNCDVKFRIWRAANPSLRLYRAEYSYVVSNSPQEYFCGISNGYLKKIWLIAIHQQNLRSQFGTSKGKELLCVRKPLIRHP